MARLAAEKKGRVSAVLLPFYYTPSVRGSRDSRIELRARSKGDAFVEREDWPRADRMAQRGQIGGGRPGEVHIEVLLYPGVVHLVFGMGGLHHDQVKIARVQSIGVIHRPVKQA